MTTRIIPRFDPAHYCDGCGIKGGTFAYCVSATRTFRFCGGCRIGPLHNPIKRNGGQ